MPADPTEVRFGSLADISERTKDVRFTPESGHAERQHRRPLSAISGHLQKQGAGTLASGSKTDRSTDIAGVRLAEADISRPEARPPGYTSCDGGMMRQSYLVALRAD
jgi:hypothetical protein